MTAHQRTLLQILEQIHRDTYAPVTTVAVATRAFLSDRHTRRSLRELERIGIVRRVGQRKGWLPAGAAA